MRYRRFGFSGHPLSIQFRGIMGRISDYAFDMDSHIKSMCDDLREKFEDTREENKAEIQLFGIDAGPRPSLFSPDGINEQFDQERKLYDKKLEQQLDELTEEEREQLELLEDEIHDLEMELDHLIEDYPQLLFQSLFIAVYSHFEKYLIDLCDDIRDNESLSLKRNDLSHKGIKAAREYLKKVARLNFPDNTEEWHIIQLLNKIRNKLVHDPIHDFRRDEVDPKLLDYFWLDDPYWDDPPWDDYDFESTEFMFSLDSLQKIVGTVVRLSREIDKAWEAHKNLRQKFQHGPKRKS